MRCASILPEGALCARRHFALFAFLSPQAGREKGRRKAELRAVAFVFTGAMRISAGSSFGPFEPIYQSMKTWHETYGASQECMDPGHDLQQAEYGSPSSPILSGAETVFVSPDGIDFARFHSRPCPVQSRYVFRRRRNFVLIPVPQLLLQPHRAGPPRRSRCKATLTPRFCWSAMWPTLTQVRTHSPRAQLAARGEAVDGLFSPLPGSGKEVVEVADAYRRAFKREPITLTGTGASQQAVRTEAERHRWLHFATHGFASVGILTDHSKPARGRANANLIASVEEVRGFRPESALRRRE